jgi:hypothetical protein
LREHKKVDAILRLTSEFVKAGLETELEVAREKIWALEFVTDHTTLK